MRTRIGYQLKGMAHKANARAMMALAILSVAGFINAQPIRTTVDGELINFADGGAMMMHNTVLVPVRGVFERLHANVMWDESSRTVLAERGTDRIKLPINSEYATVNGNEIRLEHPATINNGRTMVPLRFLSEALGARVEWVASTRTVEISTSSVFAMPGEDSGYTMVTMASGTVIPFKLDTALSSNGSKKGDRFRASVRTEEEPTYQGLTNRGVLEGHVSAVRAKTGDTPGVLGLEFDQLRMPDGRTYPIHGTLIGLDEDSVTNDNGRLVAKAGAKKDDLKFVGLGAAGGALIAIVTKGNVLSTTVIGAALGYLYEQIQGGKAKATNVNLSPGTEFGVRLTRDMTMRVASQPKS